MNQETYNYNVEIMLLNDDYTWEHLRTFVAQKMENVGTLVVKCEYLEKIEDGLNDPTNRFFTIESMILDQNSIKGVLVKVKERKE